MRLELTRVGLLVELANHYTTRGASGSVVVSKLDKQTCKSEFESHWVPRSFGLVPHLNKKLCKLLYIMGQSADAVEYTDCFSAEI